MASLAAVRDGIASFVRAEVVPPERNDDLLTGPQRLYAKDGHYVPEVVALMREARLALAKHRPENLRRREAMISTARPKKSDTAAPRARCAIRGHGSGFYHPRKLCRGRKGT